ncbi:MAG: copper amine oxidase N-terminal domain-containing protein [Syntrophomonadaceae bacterium]|nr:copper amine oxidase N-terminal domain-containing protein [Syntrophomonadaceae bacterium]
MKKWFLFAFLLGMWLPAAPVLAASLPSTFIIGGPVADINGTAITKDVAPYVKDNRTFLPIRYVAYALDIDDSGIFWDGVNQTATLMKGDTQLVIKIGSPNLVVNGKEIIMEVAPEVSNERICLPIAPVAQAFGATANWDGDKTVKISFPETIFTSQYKVFLRDVPTRAYVKGQGGVRVAQIQIEPYTAFPKESSVEFTLANGRFVGAPTIAPGGWIMGPNTYNDGRSIWFIQDGSDKTGKATFTLPDVNIDADAPAGGLVLTIEVNVRTVGYYCIANVVKSVMITID